MPKNNFLINKISIFLMTRGYVSLPKERQFQIKEFVDAPGTTAVIGCGLDEKEYGVFTHSNFIPLAEMTNRELEQVVKAIFPHRR